MPASRIAYLRVPGPRYRYRSRYRYRRHGRVSGTEVAVAAGALAVLLAGGHAVAHAASHHAAHHPAIADQATAPRTTGAAAQAIAYARHQIGKPYGWGGTGPYSYDCSGLVMMAYRSAGIDLPRTSEEQWADLHHVSRAVPGDLVFFPGSDGTWAAPGHVGLVIRPGVMIQAYATGFNITTSTYGTPGSLEGIRAGDVIGYARP